MIGRNCLFADAAKEIGGNLKSTDARRGYDLVVKGAGICGVYAALAAAKSGLKVLVVEKRANPAFEMASKLNLTLKSEGIEDWDEETKRIFFPDGEREEISNAKLCGTAKSEMDGEALFMSGSVKKSFMRLLAANKIDALFMSDVFGVATDENGKICGAAIAAKQGTFFAKCSSFLDADDNNFFSAKIFGAPQKIKSATFAVDCGGVKQFGKIELPKNPEAKNCRLARGKARDGSGYFLFDFDVDTNDISAIERRAREIAASILSDKKGTPLEKIFMSHWACECSFDVDGNAPESGRSDYLVFGNRKGIKSCGDISRIKKEAGELVGKISRDGKRGDPVRLNTVCGEVSAKGLCGNPMTESGVELPLSVFHASKMELEEKSCDVAVAGLGTGGMFAACAAAKRGAKTLGIEYFNEVGGSKIVGGVIGYYWGLKNHPALREYEADIKSVRGEKNSGVLSRAVRSVKLFENYDTIFGAIICGADVKADKFESLVVCVDSKLLRIRPKTAIDCTGDADLAAFAGVPFGKGDARGALAINYSQWDRRSPGASAKKAAEATNKDYDIIDVSKISEFQRGLFLSHYEACYYEFFPMLTPRELRRPQGMHTLVLREALESAAFPDTIAQAYSDYDPHSYPTGALSRCGLMLPHYSNKHVVNIPYGCIVPRNLDGLLFGGRGISVTHDAYQFTRMSADVSVLGVVEGEIAADCAKNGTPTRAFDVSKLISEWKAKGYYTKDFGRRVLPSTEELTARLSRGDDTVLLDVCIKSKGEIYARLVEAFEYAPTLALAKALAWFGDSRGEYMIIWDLKKNLSAEKKSGHSSDYVELYVRGDLNAPYWNINKSIAFLAKSGGAESDAVILQILNDAESGGKPVASSVSYTANRLDLHLIPNYNRIGNLCFYAERRPNEKFAKGFERLLRDENIAGAKSSDYSESRWNAYKGILEMLVASSAARCGSRRGVEVLAGYLDDIHSDYRDFARRDLADIFGTDAGFDKRAWLELGKSPRKIRPISPKYRG